MQLYYDFLYQIEDAIKNNICIGDICNLHYTLSALLNIFRDSPEDCKKYIDQISEKIDFCKKSGINAFSKGISNIINYIDPDTNLEIKFIDALPKRFRRYLYHSIGSSQTFYLSKPASLIIFYTSRIIKEKDNRNNEYIDALNNYDYIIELCNLLEFGQVYGLLSKEDRYSKISKDITEIYERYDAIPFDIILKYAKEIEEGS